MPLETATYISDLITSNPAASDPMAGADDHLRLIKATIKNTFPDVTGAVNVTQAQLNTLATGVTLLSPSGAKLRTNDYLSSSAVGASVCSLITARAPRSPCSTSLAAARALRRSTATLRLIRPSPRHKALAAQVSCPSALW